MRDEVADDAAPTVVDDGASGDGRDGRTVLETGRTDGQTAQELGPG